MVDKRDCSFCGAAIEPGTGMLFIKRDGTRHQFCSSKCRRNLLDLKRVPRTVKWTKHYVKGLGKASAVQGKSQSKAQAVTKSAPKAVAATATTGGGASETATKPEAPKAAAKKAGEGPQGGKATKGGE